MCMSISSVRSRAVSGYQNVLTHPGWKQFYRKQIFAGSFWTHMACYLENRDRAARFMRPAIRRRDRRLLLATAIQVGKSGARTKVIRAIQLTENFIGISVSIFPWNIWGRSRAGAENFPA